MPVVQAANYPYNPYPTVDTPQNIPDAYQRIQTTPDMFGGGIAQALERFSQQAGQAGNTLAGTATDLQNLHNSTVVDQRMTSFEDKIYKRMYGDPNVPGDAGYKGLKGEAALNDRPNVAADFDRIYKEHSDGLQNQRQKIMFDSQARRFKSIMTTKMNEHYEQEFTSNAQQVLTGRVATSKYGAGVAANDGDFETFKDAWGMGRLKFIESMNVPGREWAPELQEAKLREFDQDLFKDYALKLAVKNPAAADAFADTYKGYLPTEYDNVKRAVKAESEKQWNDWVAKGGAQPTGTVPSGVPKPAAPASFRSSLSAQLLGKYAVDNAVVGGPSGVEGVHPEFAQRIENMAQAMPEEIRAKFQIISGYRSTERQRQVNPRVKDSQHTSEGPGMGYAVDTTSDPAVLDWINKNGKRFGVDYALRHIPGEENHLEMLGPGGERMRGRGMSSVNNPGNIRAPGGGFRQYGSAEEGVRAMSDQLDRYAAGGMVTAANPRGAPLNTLRQIVSTWSPPNENNTQALIDQAAQTSGFSPDQVLNLRDPATKAKVIEAITTYEQRQPVDRETIRRVVSAPMRLVPPSAPASTPRRSAAAEPDDESYTAVGDSLAAHLIRKAGVGGSENADEVAVRRPGDTAVSGFGPRKILTEVIPNMSDADIRDKNVILSSGVTNAPREIEAVARQIQALRARGARNITLVGVGNDPRLSGMNEKLEAIAAANNAAFTGPLRKVAKDKIHSDDNKDLLGQVRSAKRPVQPDTPGQAASATTEGSGGGIPAEVVNEAGGGGDDYEGSRRGKLLDELLKEGRSRGGFKPLNQQEWNLLDELERGYSMEQGLGVARRQAVDREMLKDLVRRKYRLGRTAEKTLDEYVDSLRIFENPGQSEMPDEEVRGRR